MENLNLANKANEAVWNSINPVLQDGEVAFVRDKNYIKIGNGFTAFNELKALVGGGEGGSSITEEEVQDIVDSSIRPYTVKIAFNTSATKLNADNIVSLQEDKQDTLVSGTSIKTINGNSLLGSGNITISGGSGGGTTVIDITDINMLESNTVLTPEQFQVIEDIYNNKITTGIIREGDSTKICVLHTTYDANQDLYDIVLELFITTETLSLMKVTQIMRVLKEARLLMKAVYSETIA